MNDIKLTSIQHQFLDVFVYVFFLPITLKLNQLQNIKLSHSIQLAIPRRMKYVLFDNFFNDNLVGLRVARRKALFRSHWVGEISSTIFRPVFR